MREMICRGPVWPKSDSEYLIGRTYLWFTRYFWSIDADITNAQMHSGSGKGHGLQPILEGLNTLSIASGAWEHVPF